MTITLYITIFVNKNIMDKHGYPTKKELSAINQWDLSDLKGLFYFISDMWAYDKPKGVWKKDILGWYFEITLITCGWSGNESIVDSLLKNFIFNYWYYEWTRGGRHVFKCNPENIGFELVSEYCKKNNISRQAVYQNKHLYKFIYASKHVVFVKKIEKPV